MRRIALSTVSVDDHRRHRPYHRDGGHLLRGADHHRQERQELVTYDLGYPNGSPRRSTSRRASSRLGQGNPGPQGPKGDQGVAGKTPPVPPVPLVTLVRQARPAHMAQPWGIAQGAPQFALCIPPTEILLTWFGVGGGIYCVGVNGITPATGVALASPRFISGDAIQTNPALQTACVSSEFEIRTFGGPSNGGAQADRAFAIAIL